MSTWAAAPSLPYLLDVLNHLGIQYDENAPPMGVSDEEMRIIGLGKDDSPTRKRIVVSHR